MKTLEFTPEVFEQFKRKLQVTLNNHEQIFMFQGNEVDVEFAKYLIEYIESLLGYSDVRYYNER